MAEFPNAVKNFLTLNDGVDKVIAAHPNDRAGEITAIETFIGAIGSTLSNTNSITGTLIDYIKEANLTYNDAESIDIQPGEISIPDVSGNIRLRRNTSILNVDWADIDTGAEASDTIYYVYAVADVSGTGFTALISLSSSAPSGATFYRKLGSFWNNAGGDIQRITIEDESFRKTTRKGSAQVFNAQITALTWTEIDLSDYVGAREALVYLRVESDITCQVVGRTEGEDKEVGLGDNYDNGSSSSSYVAGGQAYISIMTSATGKIDLKSIVGGESPTLTITLKSMIIMD